MQQFLIALIIFLTGNIMTVFCFAFSLQNVVSCLCVYFNYYQADDAWGNFGHMFPSTGNQVLHRAHDQSSIQIEIC